MNRIAIGSLLFLVPILALADCPGEPECAPQTVWDEATVVAVTLDSPTAPGH